MSSRAMKCLRKRRETLRSVALLSVFGLVLAACGTDDDGDVASESDGSDNGGSFYEDGDLLTVVVPFGEGGGTDTLARISMPFLAEELGINIQVENVPGAGSIAGVNQFQNQRNAEDGYTMMFHSASSQIPPIVGEAGVDFDLNDQIPIAGFPLGGVIYASTDGPINDVMDLTSPHQTQQFVYGGQPAAGGELRILLLFEMLGTDVNEVLGYDGRGPARLAWEQGETHIAYDTGPAYIANAQPLVEAGDAFELMTFGFTGEDGELIEDPVFTDVPGPAEVYEQAFGEDITQAGEAYDAYVTLSVASIALNKTMIAHGDAPPEAIEELKEAWDRMLEDDEFLAAVDEEMGGYPILLRDEVDAAWEAMATVDTGSPEIQWLLEWVQTNYGVDLTEEGVGE